MDLQLNATRWSVNNSVYLVFDLEAGQFQFLERLKMSFPLLIPFYDVWCKQSTQTYEIAQIRYLEPQKFWYEQKV